jgi:2'-5' RNA ligase
MGEEMYGVVSLPDEEHDDRIRKIWEKLERELGWEQPVSATIVPHFSYHGAFDYDLAAVRERLAAAARRSKPFKIKTSVLGVWAQEQVVCFAVIVRTAALSALHEALWEDLKGTSSRFVELYGPAFWLPHITLVPDGVDRSQLPRVVDVLGNEDFDWEIEIDNLVLLHDTGGRQEVAEVFKLQASG